MISFASEKPFYEKIEFYILTKTGKNRERNSKISFLNKFVVRRSRDINLPKNC